MKVAILCESSGAVRDAFIRRGHDAVSCDLLDTDAPGPHIKGDCRERDWSGFDLIVAHPPCTYLCSSGLHWNRRRPERAAKTEEGLELVRWMLALPVAKLAIENPVGCIGTRIRKPDQIIQPWQFGEDASKATCLWLRGLPLLTPTSIVPPRLVCCGRVLPGDDKHGCPNCNGDRRAVPRWANQTDSGQNKLGPSADRWKLRSATYRGIAEAMAEQWGAA